MRAIVMRQSGGPSVLELTTCKAPIPGPNEVLVEVKAFGINRPDVWQRKGKYPAPDGVIQDVLGLEVSGVVSACGTNVIRWKPGDRICGLVAGGGYATQVCIHEGSVLLLPESLSWEEGACLPETLFTVWHNLIELGGLQAGMKVLIHGGSGGIGTIGIQIAKLTGAKVYTTASDAYKIKVCEQLGAITIPYREQDFANVLKNIPIDVILDSIGGPYFEKNLEILAEDGRLVYINAVAGHEVNLNILKLMKMRHHITGSTLRSRNEEFKSQLCRNIENNVWPWVRDGRLKPVIFKVFKPEEIQQAHELMDSGEFVGKLAVIW